MDPRPSPLHELADLHGVLTAYEGVDGRVHEVDDDTVQAVLVALGVPADDPAHATELVRAGRAARATRALDPVLVHRIGRLRPLSVVLPSVLHPRDVWLTLELEGGAVKRERLLGEVARPTGSIVVDGRRVDGYQLRLGASAATELPPGLHRLRVEGPAAAGPALEAEALLIVAPRCPQPERGWGGFLPLHALRTEDDWGVGTYGHLGDLRRWLAERGASLVGCLPLYPTFMSKPVEPSPYRPVSRLMWSELFVDPTALPELEVAPAARELLASDALRDVVASARRSVLVDHHGVLDAIRPVLSALADALFEGPSARRDQFEAFVRARPEVEAYARFRATGERLGVDWSVWGAPGRVPEGAADEGSVRYHLYAQWAAHQQLARAGGGEPPVRDAPADPRTGVSRSGLYLDVPIGVHPWGFDPWWEPAAYVPSLSVGAPPDAFFAGGQSWACPPLHPGTDRERGYRHLTAVLRHVMSMAAAVRVDHVMGLHRLYCVPQGADARHGTYVRYPDEELRALVAVEAHRSGTVVVGEDLGTVPAQVRRDMEGDGMQRSWVLQFESTPDDPLPTPPEHCMASWGTHDLPRFAAFWAGEDIEDRLSRGDLDPAEAQAARRERASWRAAVLRSLGVRASAAAAPGTVSPGGGDDGTARRAALEGVLAHLASSPARLVLVDLEDLWFERRPQNRPGTGAEAANWRRRSARTMEQLRDDTRALGALSLVDVGRRGASAGSADDRPLERGA